MELHKKTEPVEIDDDIVAFFDLLAQYDYEDQKRNAVVNPSSSASAPGELGLGST